MADVRRPGDFLREAMSERGWTQEELARIMGRPTKAIGEIVNGSRAITPRTAQQLAAALGTDAKFWLNLESEYQLSQQDAADEQIVQRARLFEKAPVAEMVRRRWIKEESDPAAIERELLEFFGLRSMDETPRLWAHSSRKSTSYGSVTPEQWAWLFRARQLSASVHAENYTNARMDNALDQLRTLLESPEEVRRVPKILADAGVRLVVVEPLAGSKIDGACFWINRKSPVVALSMRYDRIDCFWYTLLHELAHVRLGHGLGDETVPLDVDLIGDSKRRDDGQIPDSEREADSFAESFLVDRSELNDFIVRVGPLYSKTRVVGFARRVRVHPGIVVGQLHYLGEMSYANFRSMLVRVRRVLAASALTDGWGFAIGGSN